jgi:6-phosphogluconolactonase (cycloisomerase 2 family)
MSTLQRFAAIVTAVAISLIAGPRLLGHAAAGEQAGPPRAVFIQTNDPAANSIVSYQRNADGTLTQSGIFATGGKGGKALPGTESDPLASQNSLVFDPTSRMLIAVNAGSDSISVFRVHDAVLQQTQVLPSGGPFPVSIAMHGKLVYVLDAGLAGFVSGYQFDSGRLEPIAGSTRTLGLANSNPPFFLSSPAQLGFTPDGRQLVVTTKTNSLVEIFHVEPDGQLAAQPTRNAEGPVPFAFTFDPADLLTLVNAGNSSLGTFRVNDDGTLTPVGAQVSDGQAAACWIVSVSDFAYVANTGSGDISQYRVDGGNVTLSNPIAASGVSGATDMATAEGRYLYVLSGSSGSVDAYRIAADGSLSLIQTQAVPDGSSIEGIVAG